MVTIRGLLVFYGLGDRTRAFFLDGVTDLATAEAGLAGVTDLVEAAVEGLTIGPAGKLEFKLKLR